MIKKLKNVNPKKMKENKFENTHIGVKLLTAGTAGCIADLVTFPLDTAKVRLQIQGEKVAKQSVGGTHYKSVIQTITTIAKEEGPKSLYKGLAAGLQRQMCFASIRIGLYDTVKSFYQDLIGGDKESLHIMTRICAGMTTGALAVIAAQPTDVVKIRSQAMRGKESMYRSTFDAYRTIYKNDGFPGLWQGTYPNIARNAIVNVSEIVCYDLVKEVILNAKLLEDNIICHFTSGLIAGFFTTIVASPVDVIKTRYMNSPTGKYTSAIDCALLTLKNEGPTAFYKGFVPSFTRLVAWNIVMWVSYEKLKYLATKL